MSHKQCGWRWRLVLVLCILGLLGACKGKPEVSPTGTPMALPLPTSTAKASRPATAVPKTVVRFAINDVEVPLYEGMIAAFEEANPDIDVQIVSVNQVLGLGPLGASQAQIPDDAEERLVAAADVVRLGVSRETVQKGLVRDLAPLIEADPGFEAADFVAGALERYRWRGGTWALPTIVNYRLIFYNKDAFDAANVPYPEPGWSWDDLLLKAKQLTKYDGDQVTYWGFVCPPSLAYRLIESKAGGLADYTTDPPTPRLDDAAVVDALEWYAKLYRQEAMPYAGLRQEEETSTLSEEEILIDKGQAAMWPDLALLWWYRRIQGNIGVVPFPVDAPNAKTTPGWVDGLAMSAGSQHPDAAWRWMVFLTRQAMASMGQGARYLPARRSVATASGFWEQVDPELAGALRWALEHSYIANEPVGHDAFTTALRAVLGEERSVAEALAEAQATAEKEREAAMVARAGITPVPTFVVSAPEQAAAAATTITFIPGLGSFNLEPYRRLAAEFHQAHPDIVVEVKMLDITSAGGGAPDLISMARSADCFQWYPSLQDPQSLEAILNLEPFLEADESLDVKDFYPQLVRPFSKQGRLWGLPADVTPFVIEYNKALFDAAGVSYPSPDWTWDEFLDVAIALTQGEGEAKQYGFVAEVYESSDLILILSRLGAKLLDEAADPPALTLNDPSVAEALRWYAQLSTDYGVKPIFITDLSKMLGASAAYIEREGLINTGRAAMWTNAGTLTALFGPRGELDIGVAPLPARSDGRSKVSLLTTSGYFISAHSAHRQACWQWLTFLTEQPTAVLGFPARRSLAESERYRQQVGEERVAAYRASVVEAEESPTFATLTEQDWVGGGLLWLYQAYGQVLEGRAEVEEALDAAQRLAEQYRACMIEAGRFDRATWQGCLKRTDPTLPDFIFAQSE